MRRPPRPLLLFVGLLCLVPAVLLVTRVCAGERERWSPPARSFDGLSTDLADTSVLPALDTPLPASGNVLWRAERPSEYFRPGWSSPTLVAFDEVVISADRQSGPNQRLGKDQ